MTERIQSSSIHSSASVKEKKETQAHTLVQSSTEKKEEQNSNLQEILDMCRKTLVQKLEEERVFSLEEIEEILEKKEEIPLGTLPEIIRALPFFLPIGQSSPSYVISAASVEALQFLDTLCCELLIMDSEGSSKTTVLLDNETFANSPFFGAEISMEEFSTAPKVFNVCIHAGDLATTLIQAHLAGFMELLQDRKFSFGINRIDTSLLSEERHFGEHDKEDQDSYEQRDS